MGALNNVLNNFVFGMVLSRVTPEGGWQRLASEKARFKGPDDTLLHVELAPLIANLSRPSDRKILVEEFENVLKRALLREGHEIILAYLADCQAHAEAALDFHFNAALATLNLARAEELLASPDHSSQVFSMASWKQCHFNEHLLDLFIESLALDPTWVKNQPCYDELRTYGAIAA